ncbi:MAG: xanthine dehydrogenase family protein molybdopterin-binding subunit [Acidimicrobiales bacterium]
MIGERVLRVEDRRLLTGAGRYTADIELPDQAYVAFVRSPHAHANITAVDVTEAASAGGVLAVLTGQDYVSDGNQSLFRPGSLPDHLDPTKPSLTDDELFAPPAPPPIAADRVRHVGEIVALVVAETAAAAIDAAELVVVDYTTLASVTDGRLALADGAPQVWDSGNLCAAAERGDADLVATALEEAAHVVRLSVHNHRVHGSPIEPRSAVAAFAPESGRYELYAPSQGVHRFQQALANALRVETEAVRVVTPDVGGAFGLRIPCSNEYPLLLWAARRSGRPVKWRSTRSEAFLADVHGRDTYCDGTLAINDDGRILALHLDYVGNIGAHPLSFAVLSNLLRMAGPPYDVPAIQVRVRGALTNTAPTSVYRGAGRPQVTYIVERLMDLGAEAAGLDRAEIRRRNLITPAALPYRTRLGLTYDSGTFAENLETALRLIDWEGFETRRRHAEHRGKLAGMGLANYIESPGAAAYERTDVTVRADRTVGAVIGTQASGQGHQTSFAQVVAGTMGVPIEAVAIEFGDTDLAAGGSGSHADRSMRLGGTILVRACEDILEQGRMRAAEYLDQDAAGITYADGRFVAVDGSSIDLFKVAADAPLKATAEISTRLHAHPNGVAVCEVEIDPETGALAVTRYISVDDVGRAINPMIVEGQLHGGAVQGVGEAVLEEVVYETGTGQLLSGSFLNYGLPSTTDAPGIESHVVECEATSNPLGVKGAGEAGITPAGAVIVSATVDALRAFGVSHLDTPLSPERIWSAISQAQQARSVDE